jgi:RNA polymerase sigma-70 factor, ECF subfamily
MEALARPDLTLVVGRARAVAEQALTLPTVHGDRLKVLGERDPGLRCLGTRRGPFAVLALTVKGSRIVALDIVADPDRLGKLDLTDIAS